MSEEFIAQPEATESPVEPVVQEQTPSAEAEQQTPTESSPFLKIKHLDKEYDLSADDAKVYAQKGFDYDRIRLKYDESKPVLGFLEELAKESGYSTTTEYIEAAKEWKKQQKLNELVQQNIPEEYAKEIMENRTFREQYLQQQESLKEQERRKSEFAAFGQMYPDVDPNSIPVEVWDGFTKGKSLADAYAPVKIQQLQQEIAELRKGLTIQQKDAANAQTSTGAVTGQGEVPAGFFTEEQVDNMTQAEVNKHYSKVIESMKYWKKK